MLQKALSSLGWRPLLKKRLAGALLGFIAVLAVTAARSAALPEVIFVIDGSAGMWERISGQPKMAVTQSALSRAVPSFPSGVKLGLLAYGHRFRGDCGDSEILLEPGSDNRRALLEQVRSLKPAGMAPITAALQQAVQAIQGRPAETTLVLIGAGPDNCVADPCAVVRGLKKAGSRFVLQVIGLAVQPDQQAQLVCLAEAGGGRYFDTHSVTALRDALEAIRTPLEQQAAGQGRREITAPSKLGRLVLTLPTGAAGSLASVAILPKGNPQAVRDFKDIGTENTYSLLADDYELILNFANPHYLSSVKPAKPIPFTIAGGETAKLALGAVVFNVAAALQNRLAEAVMLRDAATSELFISLSGPDDAYLFQPKPVPAGAYAVVLKLVGNPTPLTLIPNLEVAPGAATVVDVNTGFRLKPVPNTTLSGWSLYRAGTEQPVLQANLLEAGSRNYPLFETFPITPGRYDLRLYLKAPDRTVLAGENIWIEQGKIVEFEADW